MQIQIKLNTASFVVGLYYKLTTDDAVFCCNNIIPTNLMSKDNLPQDIEQFEKNRVESLSAK